MRRTLRDIGIAVVVLFGAACSSQPAVDKVADGSDVAVTKADGGVVEGKITSRDEKTVTVKSGKTTKTIPKADIADVKVVDTSKPANKPALPPVAKFREYTIPEGTKLSLKLTTPISSDTSKVEDAVEATLAESVSVDGAEVLPAGSVVKGQVTAAEGAAKVKGKASITVKFTTVTAYNDNIRIDATYSETAEATKSSDAKKIGGGAAAGAVIGAILGGKKGAATGAAVGGGAGTGVVLATKGKEVEYAAGATLTVDLKGNAEVRVPIK